MNIDLGIVDALSQQILQHMDAPGLSVALFIDGEIVSRAYGVADTSTGARLTPDTTFPVASATKSFSALAMSILRTTAALDWDTPVSFLAGDLCGGAKHNAKPITIRDILSHQSGFGWHDPLWYNSQWNRATIIRKAWQTGPDRLPRSGFQYCNLMYMLAGEIIARVSGISYEEFVRHRILQPLNLKRAHFCGSPSDWPCTVARPHVRRGKVVCPISPLCVAKANAACGLRLTAGEMASWLSQYCRHSADPGTSHLPLEVFESLTIPRVVVGPEEGARFYKLFGEPDYLEYGFGWFLRRYRGHRLMLHSGKLPGACSHVALLPDLRFGVVALTNLSYSCLPETLTMALLQRFVGGPQADWITYYDEVSEEMGTATTVSSDSASCEAPSVLPIAKASACTGDYTHPSYGTIRLRSQSDKLKFEWANYRGDLIPKSGTTFSLMNLGCELLADGERVDLLHDTDESALLFLGRRFERILGEASDNLNS